MKITDIEENLKKIKNEYSLPFFTKNYEDKHYIYVKYEELTYQMLQELIKEKYENILKKQQLDKIKFYIEQSNIKNMLWGKEILKIIEKEKK